MGKHTLAVDSKAYVDRVPEPALIRGAVVAVTSVIAVVTGKAIDLTWLEYALNVYAALTPLIAGWLIRQAVVPTEVVNKIIDQEGNEVKP